MSLMDYFESDFTRCYECGTVPAGIPVIDPHDPDRLWCSVDCRDRSAEKAAEFASRTAER